MKTIKVILFSSLLLFSFIASAQNLPLTFGVKAGANLSNFSGDGADGADAKFGYNFGVTVDYAINYNWYLTSGLEFTNKGAKSDYLLIDLDELAVEKIGKIKYTANYLQLPIHVGYKLDIAEGTKINFHAGPYFAYGIAGKSKVSDITSAIYDDLDRKVDTFSDDALKRFDFGLGLGAGVEFGQINVGLGFDFGLLNISQLGDSDYPIRNQNAYLTVGYKF